MGHHRFKVTLEVTGVLLEDTQKKTVPSDDAIATQVAGRLNGFDVGEGYKVTAAAVTVKEKKKQES